MGYCGICYRSRNKNDLCHKDCIPSVDDAKMMFYLTDLIKNNTVDTNNLLYKVFPQIGKMCGTNFMEKGVRLPTSSNGGHKIFGGGHYRIFNNLPAPKVYDMGGHACMKIGDMLTQHFADGRGFEFTDSTTHSSNQDSNRIKHGIDGCKAMDLLIGRMKKNGRYQWKSQ